MPAQPYARMLDGLRRAPLLNDQEDIYQEGFPTGYEPDNPNPVIGTSLRPRDPSLSLDSFNRGMTSELRNRIFQSSRLGEDDEVGALKGLLSGYEQDINDSPLTAQRAGVDAYRGAQSKAWTAGFESPQAQSKYEREEEERKTEIPLREAEERGRTALRQSVQQGLNQQMLEREKRRSWLDRLANLPKDRNISAVGDSYIRFENQRDPKAMSGTSALANAITNAKSFYAGAKGTNREAQAAAAVESAVNKYLAARTDLDPRVRDLAYGIANDPNLKQFPSFDAVKEALIESEPDVAAEYTPDDWIEIEELVRNIKRDE